MDRHHLQFHILSSFVCLAPLLFGHPWAAGAFQSPAQVCHGQNGGLPYFLAGKKVRGVTRFPEHALMYQGICGVKVKGATWSHRGKVAATIVAYPQVAWRSQKGEADKSLSYRWPRSFPLWCRVCWCQFWLAVDCLQRQRIRKTWQTSWSAWKCCLLPLACFLPSPTKNTRVLTPHSFSLDPRFTSPKDRVNLTHVPYPWLQTA